MIQKILTLALLIPFVTGCIHTEENEMIIPKARAYYRLNLPPKKYKYYDLTCPYAFEIPCYAFVEKDPEKNSEPCWINIKFPNFKATIHVSYKKIDNNLKLYIADAHEFANRHQVKASGLERTPIKRDSAHVYGIFYEIQGNTASNIQFFVTDSTKNFLRGALYFNCTPNIDSLQVVIDFLKTDLLHLVNTFQWKQQ